jgi:octaprenyl-diphosphate synthase
MIYEDKYGEKAVDMILELIRDYADRSRKALDYFEDCDAKEKLSYMIDYMTSDLIRSRLHQNENFSI